MTIVRHVIESDLATNVRLKGAVGDGVTDDTAAINAAYAAAVAANLPFVYFPPGTYVYNNAVLPILAYFTLFFGSGATILFKGSAQWKCGDDTTLVAFPEFRDLAFKVDPSSTVDAPISFYNCGRAYTQRVNWHDIKDSAIYLRKAVLWMRQCDTRMVAGGGLAVVKARTDAGGACALFVDGGRYSSADHGSKVFLDYSGAGEIDGLDLKHINTAGLDGVIRAAVLTGGHVANIKVTACLLDAVDQKAIDISVAAGASLQDLDFTANTVNGSSDSTATAGALISIDLSAGGTMGDYALRICDNVLKNPRRRAVEFLGGTHGRVIVSNNTLTNYGTSASAASRAFYFKGSFAYLEVAGNVAATSYVHDYAVELDTVTATVSKIERNSFIGTAASVSEFNSYALHTGLFGQVDVTVSATVPTLARSAIKGAAVARTGAGVYTVTYPSAVPSTSMVVNACAEGCYCSVTRTSATVITLKFYGEGGTSLADPTAFSAVLAKAA